MERNQVNVINEVNLWHKRLGHPSCEVLSFLPSSLGVNFGKNKQDVCEICFCAKQSPGKSFVSHNKAESVFDLIHCDI